MYIYLYFERDEIVRKKPVGLDQFGLMLSSLFFRRVWECIQGKPFRWDIGCSEEA